jgi:TRAP-type C4-dicarboxylate transport system permease small subunit
LAASFTRRLDRAAERLDRWVDGVCLAVLAAMTIIACLEVFLRYVMRQSLPWAEEMPKYLMIWLTFLGASLATRRDSHVGFTTVLETLPPRARRWLVLVGRLLVLLFLYYVVRWGAVLALTMGFVSVTAALQIPFFYVFLAVPIGGGLMILQLAVLTVRDFVGARGEG